MCLLRAFASGLGTVSIHNTPRSCFISMTRTMKAAWGGLGVSVIALSLKFAAGLPEASPASPYPARCPGDGNGILPPRGNAGHERRAVDGCRARRFEHFHVGRGENRPIRDNCVAACASASDSFRAHFRLQFFRSFEGDNPAGGDRRLDSRLWIAPRALAIWQTAK